MLCILWPVKGDQADKRYPHYKWPDVLIIVPGGHEESDIFIAVYINIIDIFMLEIISILPTLYLSLVNVNS